MTVREDYVHVDGFKLFVQQRDESCEQVVVFIHGNSECSYSWEPVWQNIPQGSFRLIAYDMPGHGYSERDWTKPHTLLYHSFVLKRLLSKLAIRKPVTLVGHSQGGGVALTTAIYHPELVDRLVLVNSVAQSFKSDKKLGWWRIVPKQPTWWFKWFLMSPIGKRIKDKIMRASILYAAYPMVPDLTEERWKRDMKIWSSYKHIVAASEDMHALGISIQDIESKYLEIRMPVSIFAGEKDQLIPLEVERWLHHQIPGSSFHVMEEGGHIGMAQFPGRIAKEIIRGLDSSEGTKVNKELAHPYPVYEHNQHMLGRERGLNR